MQRKKDGTMNQRRISHFATIALMALLVLGTMRLSAQQAATRFVGTITAVSGDTLTVKTDAGAVQQVQVPEGAVLKRVEPGQKDLNAAATIQLTDLETGDRVLVQIDPNATGGTPQAARVVTIKQADVAQKQQEEREAWQKSGAAGLVKSVDTGAGVIVVTTGAGATAKTVTIHVSKTSLLKRYSEASVRFDLAKPSTIDAIQPGDQLRARGTKNADGSELTADEVVSGSFRNISGTIASLDTGSSTFTVKDLQTKRQVTVHITPDAQMHALPEMMARALANRLKGNTVAAGGPPNGAGGLPPGGAPAGAAPPAGAPPRGNLPAGGPGGAGRGGDMQQMLNRAPTIQFADLKKGEAVMLVSTASSDEVTAITLLTGVEPLLEAPEASRNLLANWSVGGGGAGEGESQ